MNPTIEEIIIADWYANHIQSTDESTGITSGNIATKIAEIGSHTHNCPLTGTVRKTIPYGSPPGFKVVHVSSNPEMLASATTGAQSAEPETPKDLSQGGRYKEGQDVGGQRTGGRYSDSPGTGGPRGGFGRRGPL